MSIYPLEEIRSRFPALNRTHNGRRAAYLDGPGGTQPLDSAIMAVTDYMRRGVANLHGQFPSSRETEAMIRDAREALADMLGCRAEEVAFGANATSLIFALSRSIARTWKPGDEIVVSEMDHRANVDPWLLAAADKGVTVRWLPVVPETLTLDLSALDSLINERTRLVAVGYASNAVGSINDVPRIAARAKDVGALVAVDAVHSAPHCGIDVRGLGADMLFCSVYKFFGGHVGVAAVRSEVFGDMDTYRLMPAPSVLPGKLETGTQSHEAIASIVPAVGFVAGLGTGGTRRERILSGFAAIEAHENRLADAIRTELARIPGVRLYQSPAGSPKTATVAFTLAGMAPVEACRLLCEEHGVFVADGDYYAATLADKLGINRSGGWIRAGMAPYTTEEEAGWLVRGVRDLADRRDG